MMDNENMTHEEPAALARVETRKQGLAWRVVTVVVAVILIAVLAYSLWQPQLDRLPISPLAGSSAAPGQLPASEAAVQVNPDSAQAQFELANSYVNAGQWQKALTAYQKTVELDPNYQAAYANMGVVYYQLEQLDLAALQYKKALELDPGDGDVAYNLGALYLQQALVSGNTPNLDLLNQAVDQLQSAVKLDPNLTEPYFSLGVAYNALNQKEKAIQSFETFLARYKGQDARASQEAQHYLDSLRKQ